jgi:hypothetical protein
MASARWRPVALEISITQRFPTPGKPLDEADPTLVNDITISIRPESPRAQKARDRQLTQLWIMRESLLAKLAELRAGKEDWLFNDLRETLSKRTEPMDLSEWEESQRRSLEKAGSRAAEAFEN